MHDQADMYESARVRCVRLLTYIDSLATTRRTLRPRTNKLHLIPAVRCRVLGEPPERLRARFHGVLVTVNTSP